MDDPADVDDPIGRAFTSSSWILWAGLCGARIPGHDRACALYEKGSRDEIDDLLCPYLDVFERLRGVTRATQIGRNALRNCAMT
jgi:hypothetical protein